MKASEIRERTDAELVELEQKLTHEIWKARFDNYSSLLDDSAKIGRLRRDLARVKTIRTQRAQAQQQKSEA
jgi:large subunit ribosomal protein L29